MDINWTAEIKVITDAPHIVIPGALALIGATWWFRGFLLKERMAVKMSGLRKQRRMRIIFRPS